MQPPRRVFALALLTALASGQQDQGLPHNQESVPGPPLSPGEALARMTVPEGFSVELVASEPDIVNPVAMTFDERGRIWITESIEYPRSSPGVGRDRVKVLEDTTGDGRADRITVFADGLNIPSGIAVGHGGVWVANSPDILFLQDTDGDGRADRREVVVTGFGRADTHELPNSLTWGPDGWLYGLNGVFNPGVVRQGGREWRFTAAMFRIDPRTRAFELFAEGTSNPWGIAFDGEGSAFISACVIDHLWHVSESGYYRRQAGAYPPFTWKIESIVEHAHQKAAYCGIHYFDSDAYPPEYRGRLYMGNIHGNCINVDSLERRGATYGGSGEADFLSANDVWFMPVAQKTGPDGCLYILDWYDRYHCHQDSQRDPGGLDRGRGRLYRVRYGDAPRRFGFDLGREADERLIELLGAPNDYLRRTAQRLLAERDEPLTRARLARLVLSDEAPREQRMHALYALAGGRALEATFHLALLDHPDPGLRAWGVRLAGNQHRVVPAVRARVGKLARDPSPEVLLQVAIAAGKIDELDPLPVLVEVLTHCDTDELIPRIVWGNLHALIAEWPEAFLDALQGVELARAPGLTAILPRALEVLLAEPDPPAAGIARLLGFALAHASSDPELASRCLEVLGEGAQSGELAQDTLIALAQALQPLLDRAGLDAFDDPLYPHVLIALALLHAPRLDGLRELFSDRRRDTDQRLMALHALIVAGDPTLLEHVEQVLSQPRDRPGLRVGVVASLGRLDDPGVADLLLSHYASMESELTPRVVQLLTQRLEWSERLLTAIAEGRVPAEALSQTQVRRLLARADPGLRERVRAGWGTVREGRDPEREEVIRVVRARVRSRPGDPMRGEQVFATACGQCHVMHGKGAEVGPDITVNGRASFEQLLSNVLDPNLVIGAAYRTHVVSTHDGRLLTGLLVEDGERRVVLRLEGGELEIIPRAEIEISRSSGVSLMPEGIENQLAPDELADLFAFLVLDRHPSDPAARRLPGAAGIEPRESFDPDEFADILAEVAPGFTTLAVGDDGLALEREHLGRPIVVRTHPLGRDEPCVLRGSFELPEDGPAHLALDVAHHPRGDWRLVVKVAGETVLDTAVGPDTTREGWAHYSIDLSAHAGGRVDVELENHASGWHNEYGYWGRATVVVGR